MDESGSIDLLGIAAVIGAVGGFITPFLSAWLILKVREVHTLTNANFSALQTTLDESLQRNKDQADRAEAVAEQLVVSEEIDATEKRQRDRANKSHLKSSESKQ